MDHEHPDVYVDEDGSVPELPSDIDAYFSESADARASDGAYQEYAASLPFEEDEGERGGGWTSDGLTSPEFRKKLVDGLNSKQLDAISLPVDSGPVMVLAGAGSGKTSVLTKRIAWLVSHGVRPESILAVTFTNKAANEMKERLRLMGVGQPQMGTFHQIGLKIIKLCPDIVGVRKGFSITDDRDAEHMWRSLFVVPDKEGVKDGDLKFNSKNDKALWSAYETAMFKAKDAGVRSSGDLAFGPYRPPGGIDAYELGRILDIYEAERKRCNKIDFADMIAGSLLAIRENPAAGQWASAITHVLVDEFQDTSPLQYEWAISILGQKNKKQNLFCVGDDNQSIYAFRGAAVENIGRFVGEYDAATILLEQNYRCGSRILDVANSLIGHNINGARKKLWTENAAGEVFIRDFWRDDDEAKWIARDIHGLPEPKQRATAILFRTKAAMMPVARALRENGVVYHTVGAVDFFKTQEIRDAMSLMRLALNPSDVTSFARAAGIFPGVGKKTVQDAVKESMDSNTSPMDIVFGSKKLAPMAKVYDTINWNDTASDIMNFLITESGLMAQCSEPGEKVRLSNLKDFIGMAGQFESLEIFAEEVTLFADNAEEKSGVTLSTIHAAKGLEWDSVYLPAVCAGHLPMDNNVEGGLEEERRLMYVAITRARRSLKVSYPKSRMINGEIKDTGASRFIGEMQGRAPGVAESIKQASRGNPLSDEDGGQQANRAARRNSPR